MNIPFTPEILQALIDSGELRRVISQVYSGACLPDWAVEFLACAEACKQQARRLEEEGYE